MHAEINHHNWLYAPHHRYGFQHVQAFVPTMRVSRGDGPTRSLARQRRDLDPLTVRTGAESTAIPFREALAATHTDALLVMHGGSIAMEEYFHDMRPDTLHLLMSCTKSYVGVLTGMLAHDGLIDPETPIEYYLPELGDTGFAGGTVRQHLDMSVGARFVEDYADPDADINCMDYAVGWRPPPPDYRGPGSLRALLGTIDGTAFPHGARFDYRSPITDVLGLLLEAVSAQDLAGLLRDRLWQPLGCEWDACITVDRERRALANGGLCATLRDFARFGQMMLDLGAVAGRQLVPAAWIHGCRHGDDVSVGAWRASPFLQRAPNGHYRNQWWCRDRDRGVLLASGIHGQSLYIDPASGVVIAKFSSQPDARDDATFNLQFALFDAIARHFEECFGRASAS